MTLVVGFYTSNLGLTVERPTLNTEWNTSGGVQPLAENAAMSEVC